MPLHLLKTAEKIPLAPIITLIGPETFVRQELRQHLTQRVLQNGLREMNFSQFHAGENELSQAIDACRDYPCFSPKRVVVLQGAGSMKTKAAAEIIYYLQNPQPSTVLILEDEKLDGRVEWVKVLKKTAHWIEIPEASKEEALQWVRLCFGQEKKKIHAEVAERLVVWIGRSLLALKLAVTQCCLYVGDRSEVELEDLQTLLVKVTEENVFEIIDALFAGNRIQLHRSLAALLETGEAPLKILALLHRHLSILLALKENAGKEAATSSLLKMSPFILRKYEQQARQHAKKLHVGLWAPLAITDVELKGSPLPKELILKRCVEKIAASLDFMHNRNEPAEGKAG